MKSTKILTLALVLGVGAYASYKISEEAAVLNAENETDNNGWLERDSAAAIDARTRADFPLTRTALLDKLRAGHPDMSDADIDTFVARHYLEAMTIDGEQRFHRKSVRNLHLLNPAYRTRAARGAEASEARISYVDSVLAYYRGTNPKGLSHRVSYRFTVEVPYNEAIEGDTLRVWMPLPLDSAGCSRQRNVEILDAEPSAYTLSGGRSAHNTIYFEAPAPAKGDTARFEYVGRFVTSGAYKPESEILGAMRPYDRDGAGYRRYTRLPDGPHIVRLDSLAHAIVGEEADPYRQSELVFDYIVRNYPWAGAREYSTIKCIPEYVLAEGHGDCGQVTLLYISLMRTLGVPARWESGWMLHPGEVNLHDWAEVYFEGVGWLPVDVSFGRYSKASDPEAVTFYSHGTDAHRFASNKGIGDRLYPAKRFVRSETVDFQLGEVETGRGNLYYPAWDSYMTITDIEPVNE